MMKLWQRYIFGRLVAAFLFFLICILGLYIAIDFSIHGAKALSKETTSWLDIGINYLCHFSKFIGFFFSISFLLAMLRVLLDLNTHREIVALQTAGLSSKNLLSPFFCLAALLAAAAYANFQWISPEAQMNAEDFYKAHATHKTQTEKVFSLVLQDGSELVYQSYDSENKELFDVFWIRSFDEIWHMKRLRIDSEPLEAQFVDQFVRGNTGSLEKGASFDFRAFTELQLETGVTFQRYIAFENRPLSSLWRQAMGTSSDKQKSAAHLHYKLALPLVPFLTIFIFAPFALRFSRSRSNLIFIACTLFTYIGLMTILDAMLILAENQAVPAFTAIWTPFALSFAGSYYFFSRIQ
jgi:lipopolysaccharide export system permease protein